MILDAEKLEKILDQQVEAYSNLEKYIDEKRQSLVSGDVEGLKEADLKLGKYSTIVEKLENQKIQLIAGSGLRTRSLKDIIENIEDRGQVEKISALRKKLMASAGNIKKQNSIISELIKHSLKMIEHSINTITNALVPESSAYNNYGKVKQTNSAVSSIVQEA